MKKSKLTLTVALVLILSQMMGMAAFATPLKSSGSIKFEQSTDYPAYGLYNPGDMEEVPPLLKDSENAMPPEVWEGFKSLGSWDVYFGEFELTYAWTQIAASVKRVPGGSNSAYYIKDKFGIIIHTDYDDWTLYIQPGEFQLNGKTYFEGYDMWMSSAGMVDGMTIVSSGARFEPKNNLELNANLPTKIATGSAGWHGVDYIAGLRVYFYSLKTTGEFKNVITWSLTAGQP
jgi:hypothetical protein